MSGWSAQESGSFISLPYDRGTRVSVSKVFYHRMPAMETGSPEALPVPDPPLLPSLIPSQKGGDTGPELFYTGVESSNTGFSEPKMKGECNMFDQHAIRFPGARYAVVGITILLLLALAPLAAAMGGETGATYSGDDNYDPAAGGIPELSVVVVAGSFSGDDAYDPAAGGEPELSVVAVPSQLASAAASSLSGDDAYDPAAGAYLELSAVAVPKQFASAAISSFSGDDAYDPAAGGLPAPGVFDMTEGSTQIVNCDAAGNTVAGGYSGDDAYDPAAGGNPEMSAMGFACAPAADLSPQ